MMAKRKMSLNELSEKVNLTLANPSILKTGKAKRFVSVRWTQFVKHWTDSRAISWSLWESGRLVFLFQFSIFFFQILLYPKLHYILHKGQWNRFINRKLNG